MSNDEANASLVETPRDVDANSKPTPTLEPDSTRTPDANAEPFANAKSEPSPAFAAERDAATLADVKPAAMPTETRDAGNARADDDASDAPAGSPASPPPPASDALPAATAVPADAVPTPGNFADVLRMLAALPLTDAERTEAVRRLLTGG